MCQKKMYEMYVCLDWTGNVPKMEKMTRNLKKKRKKKVFLTTSHLVVLVII